jgi:outer membrane lipoprotein-sorting protein
MKKNPGLLTVMLLCVFSVSAQYREATKEQKDEIVSKITGSAGEMKTMQGDFIQVKELSFMDDKVTSEGKIYYKKTDKIRWEYMKPYRYVFSTDGQNVRMTSGDRTNTVPVKSSRMFGAISKIMIGGVTGSGLSDSSGFDTQFMVGRDDYRIVLTPREKEIKEIFSSVELFVNKADCRIRAVEMIEKSGDKTTVTLKNVQVNTTIDDRLFAE